MNLTFVFVLLCLATFRAQRIVTTDEWPPSQWLRRYIDKRMGPHSSWAELVHCPWCMSVWLGAVIVAVTDRWFYAIPLPVLVYGAVLAVVGLLASFDALIGDVREEL